MTEIAWHLIWVAPLVLIVSMALAPLESLGWWAGWLGPGAEPDETPLPAGSGAHRSAAVQPEFYVVFLSGIGSISGDELLARESDFLDRLQRDLPQARIVRDVFPYAPSGRSLLTGQRFFTWFWRRVRQWRLSGTLLLPAILNLRNLFQVLVSADRRYGPIYSFGISRVVLERLAAAGYRTGSPCPLVLVGSSGGAQIALGAAPYLRAAIEAPLHVVAIGGVMASDRGLDDVDSVVSLRGSADRIYELGRIAFPGRWSMSISSHWNLALREERLIERTIGPFNHSGGGGYLDPTASGAKPIVEITAGEVARAIRELVRPTATMVTRTVS
ncbi:hypothetical protein [Mesorhizobium xinjiangense]|uniref:hypothetical protein n=1 Tax=Mesorhizobium xinjiangense TaxID=2678685 RepID=UPI0012ED9481|nr:hypothetical protein [Mesorhizobium xinjiangense]